MTLLMDSFTSSDSNTITNIDTLEFKEVQGDIKERINNFGEFREKYTSENTNNIRHFIEPTQADFIESVNFGCEIGVSQRIKERNY